MARRVVASDERRSATASALEHVLDATVAGTVVPGVRREHDGQGVYGRC